MAEYDQSSEITLVHCVTPSAIAADTNGATVDTSGYESITYAIHVGTAMAGGGFNVTIEQDDDSGFGSGAAVSAAETIGTLPTISIGDTDKVYRVGSIGKERYQRIVLTETGTISGGTIGVVAILGNPKSTPTSAQNT
jgi:hypothetical protein